MQRRAFLGTALTVTNASPLFAALCGERWDDAAEVLERATAAKQVDAAALHPVQRTDSFTRHFGKAASDDAMFLLGSISKPIPLTTTPLSPADYTKPIGQACQRTPLSRRPVAAASRSRPDGPSAAAKNVAHFVAVAAAPTAVAHRPAAPARLVDVEFGTLHRDLICAN